MSFFECEFPRSIQFRPIGSGSGWATNINTGYSGFEQRNKAWSLPRGKWQISTITPAAFSGSEQEYADLLRAFHMVVSGRFDAFRFRDPADCKFTAEAIGVGDGSTLGPYQLIKTYALASRSVVRTIVKPITSAVVDYQNNALQDTVTLYDNGTPIDPTHFSIDATTGKVTFAGGHAVANTHIITATGEFHFPVRFDSDDLPISTEESDVRGGRPIQSLSINLIEVRLS